MSLVSWAICCGAQGDAGAQLVLLGVGDAGVHQGFVLDFFTGVVAQEALAGELGHSAR
jgi:hypothetical protein